MQSMIQSARKPAHSAIAGVIGILALLVGASGVFNEVQDALNTIGTPIPAPKVASGKSLGHGS
jgi:membrane protein